MSQKLPLDPHREIFRWGPIPGKFLYTSVFTEVNYKHFCQRYTGQNWSRTLFLFKDDKMLWLNEYDALRSAGKKVFLKYMLPCSRRGQIYSQWKCEVKKMEAWHRKINAKNIASLSDKDLLHLWKAYHDDYINFWIKGTVPELGNYGADRVLYTHLSQHIDSAEEIRDAIETLIAPTQPSFYQEEEMALASAKDMVQHQKRFFWLKNSYAGTQVLSISFFQERKKSISSNIRKCVHERIKDIIKKKIDVQKTYNIPDKIMEIAHAISSGIAWQDERKKYIFKVLHYQDLLLAEVSRRYGYDMDDLHNTWFWEIAEIIQGVDYHTILEERRAGFGVDFFKKYRMLDAHKSEEYWTRYTKERIVQKNMVQGLLVSKGSGEIITGRVRIVLDPSNMHEFEKGNILIAPMTSPEYIFIMKHAAAIVTDAGGLTSHAAIVSRELGIPCIVGTKVATHAFKDGDIVEVDAGRGTVRKI